MAVTEAVRDGSWIKVRRSLAAFDLCPPEVLGPEITVKILASFEIGSIEPAFRLGLRCIPSRPKIDIAPLNTIEQELMNKKSSVYLGVNLATIILWRAEELMPEYFHPSAPSGGPVAFRQQSDLPSRITKLVETYLESSTAPLFLGTVPLPPAHGGAPLGSRQLPAIGKAIAALNALVFELSEKYSRVQVLDVNWWAAQEGRMLYDLQMDFLAKQPLTVRAAVSLGFFIARNLRPLIIPRHKVLAVDLDNTLWGGILGEDGVQHLKLGHDFPGNVYLQIQREILELKNQGVLLVLVSKNEESLARQAFEQLPNMLLRWSDFVCRKVNFEPKYLNLRAAAAELGLGLDSFSFLDDSDFEREQMKSFSPEVLVLNDQSSALHMLSSLRQTDAFDTHQITREDLMRHREYELRTARNAPAKGDLGEFLSSLRLQAIIEPLQASNYERAVQMLGKTNQFNLTTRRHQMEELKRLASQPGAVGLVLTLVDKFGDQGIVGMLLALPDARNENLSVDSFLVSCRALSRGVEDVLWAELVSRAYAAKIRCIYGTYLPTAKNGLVAGLYGKFGLRETRKSETGADYVLESPQPIAFPDWIAVKRKSP